MNEKTPIKLTQLLQARDSLVRRATLANMSFVFRLVSDFTHRVERARLRGLVCVKSPEASGENWASLTALEGSQSQLDEHFSEEDVMDLADAVRFVSGGETSVTFRIENIGRQFLSPLRNTLQSSGIEIDLPPSPTAGATNSASDSPPETGWMRSQLG